MRLNVTIALTLIVSLLQVKGWTGEVRKSSETEWKQVLQAAESEGNVTIILPPGDNRVDALRSFQKRYSKIQTEVATSAVGIYSARIMAERRAQKYLWDICLCGTATAFRVFYQGKHLDPVKPILILPEVLDQSNWLSGKHHYLDPEEKYIFVFLGNASQALSFNKNLLNPAEFKSYWDLLAPKWKGKIVVRDPRAPGSGGGQTRFLYYHPKIGPQYLIRLFTEMEPVLTRDDSQALEWLAKGKVALCFFCRGDQVTKAQRQGLPVDSFPPGWKEGESLQASFGTISLMNRAPHPNAAKVYINWFLSRDGQKTFQEIMNRPPTSAESLRTDIPKDVVPQDQRRRDGIEYVMADQSEWLEMEPIYKLVNEALVKVARERASK